jgi:putative ABC transport system ATP-binding protein
MTFKRTGTGRLELACRRSRSDDGAVLFDLSDVTASRGGHPVLRGLTLEIGEGATALVGPSGSGKSTLLRLLVRLSDPETGEVRYRGEDVRSRDVLALRREVQLVPQLPAPLGDTVRDDVMYGPRLAGRDADVERALRLAGLDASFAPRETARLSVGEQQRVMLARALALEPAALLLDEPTSALDEEARGAVEDTLRELRDTLGISYVVVTHDEAQAERLADDLIRLKPVVR